MWLSVPPETSRNPRSVSARASVFAFSTTRFWYSANSAPAASANATALAAITCSSGPPWTPGKTVRSRSFAEASRQRMSPPRGPRNVLWVVLVTNGAWGTGEPWRPAITRPAMWAMSAMTEMYGIRFSARRASAAEILPICISDRMPSCMYRRSCICVSITGRYEVTLRS